MRWGAQNAHPEVAMAHHASRRALILVDTDYEDLELQYPKYRLIEAGMAVTVAGPAAGARYIGKNGYPQTADIELGEADPERHGVLVIPGGWAPDKLRRSETVKALTARMSEAGKVVASICHGPWINISAGVVAGRTYTSSPALIDDLRNAGAQWVDQEVAVDGTHISSRRPDDLPAFCAAVLRVVETL